jgi:hypothetical protein
MVPKRRFMEFETRIHGYRLSRNNPFLQASMEDGLPPTNNLGAITPKFNIFSQISLKVGNFMPSVSKSAPAGGHSTPAVDTMIAKMQTPIPMSMSFWCRSVFWRLVI